MMIAEGLAANKSCAYCLSVTGC